MSRNVHYHVLSGIHGYMPDRNEVHETRASANDDARGWVADCREQGSRFRGSARAGYYDATRVVGGVEYVSIETCYERDCLGEEY